jgi:hypothetical protein
MFGFSSFANVPFASIPVEIPSPVIFIGPKGGIKSKKKEYKNIRNEILKDIESAVKTVTGEPITKISPKIEKEKPVTFVEDYEAILRMETEKAALELAIAQMLEDERDDEEAILLLL